ncbi:histidine phosphatase family protein [Aestuariimicrobium ganziense]|uniref:histidine phosphatase family protein n=1 Tax=Aestuariimicrobium ganziense TaxID=2773677 RepID=UPI001944AFE7|nr:histidine phosphatase family protein [Aestuariimicrobium ganziense]
MKLILVRHGQTDSNVGKLLDTGHPGAPLNVLGSEQAATLVETLAGETIDAVFSSDLLRAQQTAQPLAEALGVEAVALPAFREIYAGEHDMATDWQPYFDVFQQWFTDTSAKLPGGESWDDFLSRWDCGIEQVEATGVDCAVVVSHGAAISSWVPYASQNMETGSGMQWRLPNTSVIVMTGSSAEGWRTERWGEVVLDER